MKPSPRVDTASAKAVEVDASPTRTADTGAGADSAKDEGAPGPRFSVNRRLVLGATPNAGECAEIANDREALACATKKTFAADERAQAIALELLRTRGDYMGVEEAQRMDGGFRGTIRLEPHLPIGRERKHLEWVQSSLADFDRFMTSVTKDAPPDYRVSGIFFRFLESVGRTTPSAYASGFRIGYNVNGSLLRNEEGVRETLFHEIFHLNDEGHHDWSMRVLKPSYDGIVRKCGTRVACLDPYAPNSTKVRGGTYYAFQPGNGESVREYGAELAVRYYREMRGELGLTRAVRPRFKCGPSENRLAWDAFVGEFFHGVDLGPPC